MKKVRVSAPGKLMVSGEYAVLDGAEALVVAVDRRLIAVGWGPAHDVSGHASVRSPESPTLPPEALLSRQYAEAECGQVSSMSLAIDASELRRGDQKLGLGSSSAASVAVAGAVLAWHGEDPAERRKDVLRWALAGHRAIAPDGSGADVAAACLGGLVRFRRTEAEAASQVEWPEGLGLEVVWTGKPARTSDLVAQVRRLERSEPQAYARSMSGLRDASDALLDAFVSGDAGAAVRSAQRHGRAMAELGRRSGAPIVEERLAAVSALAERCGGSSKPSGAGGGDVALAFFDDPSARAQFCEACPEAGLTLLSMKVGEQAGVRREEEED